MQSVVNAFTVARGRLPFAVVVLGDAASALEVVAAETLREYVRERTGANIPIVREAAYHPAFTPGLGVMLLGTRDSNRRLNEEVARSGISVPDRGSEGFAIAVGNPSSRTLLLVCGADERGVLYGVGKLLRTMLWRGGGAEFSAPQAIVERPHTAVRGHLLATHLWSPSYDNWSPEQYRAYLRDLAIWGTNLVLTVPVHFPEWHGQRPFADPPFYASEDRRREWESFWASQCAVPDLARTYGMDFGIWLPPNDVFPDEVELRGDDSWVDNACPSLPEMRTRILEHRERVFRDLSHLDVLFIPSADTGGCRCAQCMPWARTFLSLAEETAALARTIHPNVQIAISNQEFSEAENEYLYKFLQEEKPDWLQMIVFGPLSRNFAQARRRIPARYRLMMYPDITHFTGGDYLFVPYQYDSVGARFYQHSHEEVFAFTRPHGLPDVHRATRTDTDGSFPYSEGIHDDVNKALWSQLDWNPRSEARSVIREYASLFFGSDSAEAMTDYLYLLEENLAPGMGDRETISEAQSLIRRIAYTLPDWAAAGWRWPVFSARGEFDRLIQLRIQATAAVQRALEAAKAADDPRPALRELGRVYDGESWGITQNERELSKTLAEIGRLKLIVRDLGDEALRRGGIELDGCYRIQDTTTDFDWAMDDLRAAALSPDGVVVSREAIQHALAPEDAGPGGVYVNCGDPRYAKGKWWWREQSYSQPHLVRGTRWTSSWYDDSGHVHRQLYLQFGKGQDPYQRDFFMGNRSQQIGHVWARDGGALYRFEGLDPEKSYQLRVTYCQFYGERRRQALLAGAFVIHADLLLPDYKAREYEFQIPRGAYREGRLDLTFKNVGGWPDDAIVNEIWIIPAD